MAAGDFTGEPRWKAESVDGGEHLEAAAVEESV